MIKTASFIAAALVTLVAGAAPADAAITSNGIHTNAITSNGVRMNALTNNGLHVNALTNNGTRLNAITVNGATLRGAAAGADPIAVVPAITSVRLGDGTIVTVR